MANLVGTGCPPYEVVTLTGVVLAGCTAVMDVGWARPA